MHSIRRCPSCWSTLPAGVSRCAACGAELTVARWRAIAWAALLIAVAGSGAWWLRGSFGGGSGSASPATAEAPRAAPPPSAPETTREPNAVAPPAAAPTVSAGEAVAALPDARLLEAQRLDIVGLDRRGRTLRRATAFVVEAGICAVPAGTLNGAIELMRADGATSRDVAWFDPGSVALLAQSGLGAAVAIAKPAELAPGAPLFVLGEGDKRGTIFRCGNVAKVDRTGAISVEVEVACSECFLFDQAGRLVGLTPTPSAAGIVVQVTPIALEVERLASARATPLDVLNASVFDRDGDARRERAALYAASREYGAALAEYLAAIELEPRLRDECTRTAAACVQLALRNARLDDSVGELLPTLETAARLLDREPVVLYAYGLALLDLQRPEEAVDALLAALRVSSSPDAAMNDALRSAYLHASERARSEGRPADAVRHAEDALARFPQDVLLMKSLGFAYYEFGDAARARDLLVRVVELDPSQERGLSAILAALAPEASPSRTTGAPGEVVIHFEPKSGAIRSRATFNDRSDAEVLVDTGATMTALPTALANDLGYDLRRPVRTVQVETANGKVIAPVVSLDAIDLQGARVTNVEAVVLPDGDAGLNRPLIGLNFLQHFSMTLDAQHGVLRLSAKK
jgi:clan AA aspartic protease (TIGR02281 family)